MNLPKVVSRDEWVAARKRFLVKEKEFTRASDQRNAERRRLPMVRIDKEYVFDGPDGKPTLLDLFAQRRQLIVYHFMFDPAWDAGCEGCSIVVDNIGHLAHLHARDEEYQGTVQPIRFWNATTNGDPSSQREQSSPT